MKSILVAYGIFRKIIPRADISNIEEIKLTFVKTGKAMKTRYLIFPIIVSLFIISGCQSSEPEPVATLTGLDKVAVGDSAYRELAIARCRERFNQQFSLGEDFKSGVCLAPEIIDDWACSVAPESDLANERDFCASYQSGEVGHVVILDSSGKLISAE